MKHGAFGNEYVKWHISEGSFWFRLFGYGLLVKDLRVEKLLLDEKNGMYWIEFDYFIKILT